MLFTFLGLVLAVALVVNLLWYSEKGDQVRHMIAGLVGVVLGVICTIGITAFLFLAWEYKAAEYKAVILNHEYGTTYTAKDVFYAHSVIDTIRQLDRNRVEVNGNLFKK